MDNISIFSVSLSARVFLKLHIKTFPSFPCIFTRGSMEYTSCFGDDILFLVDGYAGATRIVLELSESQRAAPGMKSIVYHCLVFLDF